MLHLGSGGGSLDCQLKTTYRVTGVDVSAAMIMHAKRVNPEVEYVCGDIRTVRLGRTFDAVLVHDAIAYMTSVTELEQVYHTAAAHLEPGGVMVALPEELRTRFVQDRTEVKTRTRGARTVTFLEVDHDPDPADHSFEAVFVLVIREGKDVRIETDRHVLGLFELYEFLDAMRSAGFDPVAEPWELSDWEPGQEMPLITAVLRGGSTPTRPR